MGVKSKTTSSDGTPDLAQVEAVTIIISLTQGGDL